MAQVSVDNKHPEYAVFAPEWATIADCVAGERAVKKAGQKYLPHPAHNPDQDTDGKRYKQYKHRAAFLNATGRTEQAMLGVAFNKPVNVNMSGALADLVEDCDGKGTPVTQVLRGALAESLETGRYGFLTDYSAPARFDPATGDYVPYTAAEQQNARATIQLFYASEIINWRVVGDVTTLVVLKSKEEAETNDPDDFATYPITVWTELRMVDGKAHMRRWFYNSVNQDVKMNLPRGFSKTGLSPLMKAGGAYMDRLPWAWGGSIDNNATIDSAPLADIASLNIKHYCAEADVAEIAHIVGQPTLVMVGLTQAWVDKNLKNGIGLGATKGVQLGQDMDAKLLQAEERNLSVGLCERREKQMAMLGAALIERGSAPKTATEAQFDAQTDNSILALCAGNVESAFNKALEFATDYLGGAESTVILDKFYSEVIVDSQTLTALMAGVQSGTIRLLDFIKWLMGQGIIDDSETPEQVADDLRNQEPLPTMAQPEPQYDDNGQLIDPNAPPVTDPAQGGDNADS